MGFVDSIDAFCGSKFWDWNATWFTNSPHLTPCFEETVLIWIPNLYMLVFFFYGYRQCCKSIYREIPWGYLNITKLVGVCILILITITDTLFAIYWHPPDMKMYSVDYSAGIVKSLMLIKVVILTIMFRKNGIRTSCVTQIFWLLLLVCSIPHYVSQIEAAIINKNDIRLYPYISNIIYFSGVFSMFLIELFVDARPIQSLYPPLKYPPTKLDVSFLNNILLIWFDVFAFRNYRKKLSIEDLPGLEFRMRLQYLVPLFNKNWNAKCKKIKKKPKNKSRMLASTGYQTTETPYTKIRNQRQVSVVSVLWSCFSYSCILYTFLKILSDILTFVSPQILRKILVPVFNLLMNSWLTSALMLSMRSLFQKTIAGFQWSMIGPQAKYHIMHWRILFINYLQNDEPVWRGYLYTIVLTLTNCGQSFLMNSYSFNIMSTGLQARSVLSAVVFRKVLRISNGAKRDFTTGDITNLMSVDAQRFLDVMLYTNMAIAVPVTVLVSLYFLWDLIGFSAFAGLILLLLIVPFNMWAGRKMRQLQILQMKYKDERVNITNEVLTGIKVLKMYAWEASFSQKILQIREQELALLKRIAYLDTIISFTWMTAPIMISLVMFAVFTLSDDKNVLTTEIALVSLSLFNTMKTPISLIPRFVSNLTQASVAAKRLTRFLNAEELDNDVVEHIPTEPYSVVVERGMFTWDEDDHVSTLKNINLQIEKGSLVAIVGPVGSGKSSLLAAILGEMYKLEGRINTKGSIAYVPQQAWIQNAPLRDNILFMSPFEATKYNKVVESCALLPDLQMLPGGDLIEIGEKGINLSGGQKQRISLARAVYNDADIYFLDDPLSAVDAHVGKHIFENVIGPNGLLKRKTRLLVTNAISYLPEMDFIVVMSGGAIVQSGTYENLLSEDGEFANLIANFSLDENTEKEIKEDTPHSPGIERMPSNEDISVINSVTSEMIDDSSCEVNGGKLIEVEQMQEGEIKWEIYMYYIKAGGVLRWVGTLLFNFLYQVLSVLANLWLTFWSTDPAVVNDVAGHSTAKYYYLSGYMGFAIGIAASVMLATLTINFAVVSASSFLHESLLQKVLCWPAYIFDITPLGRILNRFSYDIDVVDNSLPFSLKQLANIGGTVFATLCVIMYSSPIFVLALIPLVFIYRFMEQLYVGIMRQQKRLEATSRSPLYSHFSETITGASTIRAYNMEENFIQESDERIFKYQVCANPSVYGFKWICFRLDGMANLIILISSLLAVYYRGTQNAGILSLSITYALQLTRSLTWVIRSASDIESNVVSVERIREYENTPMEKSESSEYKSISASWPDKGVIVFDGYKARYRDGLDFVLHGVDLRIESGEKVGVVGRTGAGKSSLTLSLFRIFEAAEGRIIIDGVDISHIQLSLLRSRITIIPQDPVLFSGTVRLNLDPFFDYTDEQLWTALELAHLKNFVASLPKGLAYEIKENGGNLSIGQRQLICLARALLRKTKILVLDEATAAIDLETDELIQKTIRKEFKECTVLTIAHKLNTVMDSDRIVVLDKGLVKEFDSPARLLESKNSIFYSMAKQAGLVS